MKLADVLAVAAPFLATDKKPADLQAAILAADKKAKDAAGSGLGARELEEKDKPGAQDATGYEEAMDEREEAEDESSEAMDSRMAAEDAEEEEKDKDKADDKKAKDRKAARDARKGARDRRKAARDSRKAARDSRKGARDKRAKDRNDDPEGTNPGADDEDYMEGSNPSTPGGSRAGGKTTIDKKAMDAAIADAIGARDALHAARAEVEPILGKTAFDSAETTYVEALKKLEIAAPEGTPTSALRAMLSLAKDRASVTSSTPVTMDAANVSALAKIIPGYGRLK